MTQITGRKDIPLADMLAEVKECGSDPQRVLQVSMDLLEEVHGGTNEIVDATSPFAFLWETAGVTHTASIEEGVSIVRRLYPSLAQTPENIYHHMSYKAYLNRFSSPSRVAVTLNVQLDQLRQYAVRPTGENYRMIIIPRDTKLTVAGDVTFMLPYPVVIKLSDANTLQVYYDNEIISPFQQLTTNALEARVYKDASSNVTWIRMDVEMIQINAKQVTDNVQRGYYFVQNISFTDQFFFVRAYYQTEETGDAWIEMLTTHSPVVYDPNRPTLQLKVTEQMVNVSLPLIYQNSGLISGAIRIDVFTSKGDLVQDMSNFAVSDFILDMSTLDPARDTGTYTAALNFVTVRAWTASTTSGGKGAVPFPALIERVVDNAVGELKVPITNIQVSANAENSGFDLVTNVDVLTNRAFLATRKLPAPSNTKLMTSANVGIATYITDNPSTISHPWVAVKPDRTTFLAKNLYQSVNGVIRLLSRDEVIALQALQDTNKLAQLNNNRYLYSPFYYVVDRSSLELTLRPYHLDKPEATNLNFVLQNQTLNQVVNTASYFLEKTDTGYRLTIQTKSGAVYKQMSDASVGVQLAVYPTDSSRLAYWKGVQVGTLPDGERVFQFDIVTDHDINSDHHISFTNAQIDQSGPQSIWVDLKTELKIIYVTSSITSNYKPDATSPLVGTFLDTSPIAGVTHEILSTTFGHNLSSLWSRSRTLPDQTIYQRYTVDVPLIATKTIYKQDAQTGSAVSVVDGEIVFDVLYQAGAPILDEQGQPLFRHRKGDVILQNGIPVIDTVKVGRRELDMMFVDGRHYFVDDPAFLAYNNEFVKQITTWILQDMSTLQAKALEKTKFFFYPKNQLTSVVLLNSDGIEVKLDSEQSLTLDIYVTADVFRSADARLRMREKAIRYLDTWIGETTLSVSDAAQDLKGIYGDSVTSLRVRGLGGPLDMQFARISQSEARFCLKRILDAQQDGSYIISEDVTINWYQSDPQKVQ